jgi:hypothetical protein
VACSATREQIAARIIWHGTEPVGGIPTPGFTFHPLD